MEPAATTDPRVATVVEHMRLENEKDFAGCIGKFTRPRYEVLASEELYDGEDRVHDFLRENHTAFPDFEFVVSRVSPATDVVVVEGRFTGTQLGPWRGLPPTGRRVDLPICLVFEFEGEDMMSERLYFDIGTALHQLGVADDPDTLRGKVTAVLTHPLVVTGSWLRAGWQRIRGGRG
jgi:predicted ester cyclase